MGVLKNLPLSNVYLVLFEVNATIASELSFYSGLIFFKNKSITVSGQFSYFEKHKRSNVYKYFLTPS